MTQLSEEEREQIMAALWGLEASLHEVMKPSKVNIASLGNMTPHIHWHVIPRYRDDAYFPGSVWSVRLRDVDEVELAERRGLAAKLGPAITDRLS
jgi:diadenosine tetraphosphate (Ap4A) HIT family hydrolase